MMVPNPKSKDRQIGSKIGRESVKSTKWGSKLNHTSHKVLKKIAISVQNYAIIFPKWTKSYLIFHIFLYYSIF